VLPGSVRRGDQHDVSGVENRSDIGNCYDAQAKYGKKRTFEEGRSGNSGIENQSLPGSIKRLNNCFAMSRLLCFCDAMNMSIAISFIRPSTAWLDSFEFFLMLKAYAFGSIATMRGRQTDAVADAEQVSVNARKFHQRNQAKTE
jgi:hypothetical protein